MKKIIFEIDPVGKPRMVRSDVWAGRKCVDDYWVFKKRLIFMANQKKYVVGDTLDIKFFVKMPESWSITKKKNNENRPHKAKPDTDNMIKAFLDSLCKNDSNVWKITASKYWARKGQIHVMI